ncbi:MAG: L-histidine N(alpha)-methyltransferase [Desulfobacter sp.]
MYNYNFARAEDFDPAALGPSCCMNFDSVLHSFTENPDERINGALGGYIFDVPQFPGDLVKGGLHYDKYAKSETSVIPQRQPALLEQFARRIKDIVKPGASFFDLGPGPEYSIRKNTIPALKVLAPSLYIPVDIESEFTEDAYNVISQEFPDMNVRRLAMNFHKEILPEPETETSIIWYSGSTFGNLSSLPGQTFLENKFAANHLGLLKGAQQDLENGKRHTRYLVLLMDGKKEATQDMLDIYAHPDAANCFKSVVFKLKRDLLAHDFDPEAFIYEPCWNGRNSTIEHVFTATKTQSFRITNCFTSEQATVRAVEGENYVLANSMKPSNKEMQQLLINSGWDHLLSERDPDKQFHIHLARGYSQG